MHLDVYQGKNKNNIDIHEHALVLPTTQKAVANALLKSGVANDPNGSRHIMMDNRYCAPQLLALMSTNWNCRGVGTCRANRKGFDSKSLLLPNNAPRGSFVRLVDPRLGMIITRWKDSKVLQTVSTTMDKGVQTLNRRTGSKVIQVTCPSDIVRYQKFMGGVDRGDQHRVMGAGFANVSHFKKWYKKAFLGIADFSMLNAFAAWNLSVEQIQGISRGGSTNKHRQRLVKWQFYAVAAEELMNYVDPDEETTRTIQHNQDTDHKACFIPKDFAKKQPHCIICSMEESVWRKCFQTTNRKGRSYSRRSKFLAMCSNADCKITAHTCPPAATKMNTLPQFLGMSCFEIAHSEECKDLFAVLERDGQKYYRTKPTHPIANDLLQLYQEDLPRRSNRVGRPPRRPSNEGFQTPESSQASVAATKTPPSSSTRVAKPAARKRTPQEMTPPTRRVTRSSRHVITRRTRRRKYK